MNKIFNQAWRYFAGGATVLAYGTLYDRIKTPQKNLEYKNEINAQINAVQQQLSNLEDLLSSSIDEETKNQIMEKVNSLTLDLNNMKAIHNNYFSNFEKLRESSESCGSLIKYISKRMFLKLQHASASCTLLENYSTKLLLEK